MYYEQELRLVCDTLRRCGVQVGFADASSLPDRYWALGPYSLVTDKKTFESDFFQSIGDIQENTVYQLTDPFSCRYLCFRLPELDREAILTIGPYLTEPVTPERLLEATEDAGISPAWAQQLLKYYYGLPLIQQGSHLLILLDTFFERLWGVNGYGVETVSRQLSGDDLLLNAAQSQNNEARLRQMEMMETRYAMENELMDAIAGGQFHKVEVLFSQFSMHNFERRVSDSVRNTKNYCIIINTLFRKAAEKGGVHPYYLDSVSTEFAQRIEQLTAEGEVSHLMLDMARSYCRLSRNRNMKNYSALVQRAVVYIEGDLAGSLSLRVLAENLNVNASYLSALFKKETGLTVTEFIMQRRMELAMQLLKNTRLQVQNVAQHCGIVDVHYFTKLFKRHTGLTPREYRQA